MPKSNRANVLCWSSYKHHHTIKFLVGIAPDGTITFISKAYGGRITDSQLTVDCGILKKLEPGDEWMADKVRDHVIFYITWLVDETHCGKTRNSLSPKKYFVKSSL